ncbi:hypothetical protein EC2730350_4521 [Escherichia coli 2730350]|nr:hypothetical protein EC2730350_4521 [Escherichia coli 2730350]
MFLIERISHLLSPDAWAKKSPSIEGLGMGDQREEKRQASGFFQTR